jgi:hypothetical protein
MEAIGAKRFFTTFILRNNRGKMLDVLREKIIHTLDRHFKYDTMNSWNGQKSYAKNVKLGNIVIPDALRDICYDLTQAEWFYDNLMCCEIEEFEERNNNRYTIGFNGRSGGYCVLYKMSIKTLDYKTRCDTCWKPTWYDKVMPCQVCGKTRGGTLRLLTKPMTQKQTDSSGFGDADELDDDSLLHIFHIVIDFNITVTNMIESMLYYAREIKEGKMDLNTGSEPEEEDNNGD